MRKKVLMEEAIGSIQDGFSVAIGGNVLHRAPMALIRELVRQKKKGLKLIKTAGAHDVDVLVRGGCVASVDAGFISYETEYGLAKYYRKAVETGLIKANEHACYTVISALNAARIGVPFMPVKGLMISDLIEENDYFDKVVDPFSGESITVVKALVPDVAILHVHACDEEGNAIIEGPKFEDVLMSRAAKSVILSTEKILPKSQLQFKQDQIVIPGFLVKYIVEAPKGAAPGSMPHRYEVQDRVLKDFLLHSESKDFNAYIAQYARSDHRKGV